jgi:hypothetical protein
MRTTAASAGRKEIKGATLRRFRANGLVMKD